MKYFFGSVCIVAAAYLLGAENSYWGWFLFAAFWAVCW